MNELADPIVLSVSQLTQAIKWHLEGTFSSVWVQGEISNVKVQASGHIYFSLKDEGAQIAAVAFRQDAQRLDLQLQVGAKVLVRGMLNVWPPKGNYQLIVKELSHVGLGEELAKLEALKQKLLKKGWFDVAKKKRIPPFPKVIGVVTSPTGAVIQDILNILSRRLNGFHLILNPVNVQGAGAADEIVRAIYEFNSYRLADVLIVGRGGGSFEDLAAFNSEAVAEAIFASTIPVISAVGHETDVTIADFVADMRAPTPSAAAELVSEEHHRLISWLTGYDQHLRARLRLLVQEKQERLARIVRAPLFTSALPLLGGPMQALDEVREAIDQSLQRVLAERSHEVARLERRVGTANPSFRVMESRSRFARAQAMIDRRMQQLLLHYQNSFASRRFDEAVLARCMRLLETKRAQLQAITDHLHAINPKNLLLKGYSILFSQKDGSVITSVQGISPGTPFRALLSDGTFCAQVTDVTEDSHS